jgi:hypothetical protein
MNNFECDDADPFVTEEWAAFKRNGLWGFVDRDGFEQIAPRFEEARSFSHGLAGVMINGEWSFINKEGNVVISGPFEDVDYFNSAGICFVKEEMLWRTLTLYYTG